jgi:membrane protease YdiL (CAAX protease family)
MHKLIGKLMHYMAKAPRLTYFSKQPQFKFDPRSVLIFIVFSFVAWGINIFGQSIFPSQNMVPFLARTVITLVIDVFVVALSIRLFKQNCLPSQAMGLSITGGTLKEALVGVMIGLFAIAIIAGALSISIPYHFVKGTLSIAQVFKESVSYLLGNSLEEILFRGFLFVVLSQLKGWRVSTLIMAFAFGLFHLQAIGFTVEGIKMVATTISFGLIFGLSYVLTKSLWTAICTHVTSNIFLHAFAGLDGRNQAMFVPIFEKPWPKGYDLGLWVILVDAAIVSYLLYRAILARDRKSGMVF